MTRTAFSSFLDDLLLDLATIIELSDNDRAIAIRRFALLGRHLQRPSSPLRELLMSEAALIYAQGSMAIGATILSGDDDRFDVDALIDVPIRSRWTDAAVLDVLEEALRGFPGVMHILRCTRCVQLQFGFMHMDVTVLDSAPAPRIERAGEIFHSPDSGHSYRVKSNPYAFSTWYRGAVRASTMGYTADTASFEAGLQARRRVFAIDRLASSQEELARVDQEHLPEIVPPRLDAQQVVALKLLKRYLNRRYRDCNLKRPPSIYLTKKSADCGYAYLGLAAQLEQLAVCIRDQMEEAHAFGRGPFEENPEYPADKINDRWPASQADRLMLVREMNSLLVALEKLRTSTVAEIQQVLTELFGERVSKKAYDHAASRPATHIDPKREGVVHRARPIYAGAASTARIIQPHNFHSGRLLK